MAQVDDQLTSRQYLVTRTIMYRNVAARVRIPVPWTQERLYWRLTDEREAGKFLLFGYDALHGTTVLPLGPHYFSFEAWRARWRVSARNGAIGVRRPFWFYHAPTCVGQRLRWQCQQPRHTLVAQSVDSEGSLRFSPQASQHDPGSPDRQIEDALYAFTDSFNRARSALTRQISSLELQRGRAPDTDLRLDVAIRMLTGHLNSYETESP